MKFKRGDVFQILFALIMLFIVGILALLVGTLVMEFTGQIEDSAIFDDAPIAQEANEMIRATTIPTFDFFIFFFFLSMNIGLIIAASRTNFSPIIMFLFIILLFIEIFVAAGFVNIYQGFAEGSVIEPVASRMFLANLIFSKYTPLIMGVLAVTTLIIMYSKSGGDISA